MRTIYFFLIIASVISLPKPIFVLRMCPICKQQPVVAEKQLKVAQLQLQVAAYFCIAAGGADNFVASN